MEIAVCIYGHRPDHNIGVIAADAVGEMDGAGGLKIHHRAFLEDEISR